MRKPLRGCSPRSAPRAAKCPRRLCGGRLAVDQVQRLIRIDGHPIGITEMEYRVLELLAFARNNVVTRTMLLEASLSPRRTTSRRPRSSTCSFPNCARNCGWRAMAPSSSRPSRSAAGSCATSITPPDAAAIHELFNSPRDTLGGMIHFLPESPAEIAARALCRSGRAAGQHPPGVAPGRAVRGRDEKPGDRYRRSATSGSPRPGRPPKRRPALLRRPFGADRGRRRGGARSAAVATGRRRRAQSGFGRAARRCDPRRDRRPRAPARALI